MHSLGHKNGLTLAFAPWPASLYCLSKRGSLFSPVSTNLKLRDAIWAGNCPALDMVSKHQLGQNGQYCACVKRYQGKTGEWWEVSHFIPTCFVESMTWHCQPPIHMISHFTVWKCARLWQYHTYLFSPRCMWERGSLHPLPMNVGMLIFRCGSLGCLTAKGISVSLGTLAISHTT